MLSKRSSQLRKSWTVTTNLRKLLIPLTFLSFGWGFFIVASVVVNADWAHSFAASGGFETFPIWLRWLYLGNLLFLLYQFLVFGWLINGLPIKPIWIPKFLIVINGIGFLMNLISRSPNERFNSIGLGIITLTFWLIRK